MLPPAAIPDTSAVRRRTLSIDFTQEDLTMKLKPTVLLIGLLPVFAVASDSGTLTVGQKDKSFAQSEVTVKVGGKIVFKNDDIVVHNVFSGTEGQQFNLKTQVPGSESSKTFDKEGTVEVRCAIHPKMKMVVKVVK